MSSVLLIEDDRFLNDLYTTSLDRAGYAVHRAQDAQVAIDILDEYGCDIILLDLMLPGHNGVEILQEVQSYSDWQTLPVIVLSAQHPKHGYSNEQWAEYGVREYMYKPEALPADVVQAVGRYVPV